jgi:hypothetical protein
MRQNDALNDATAGCQVKGARTGFWRVLPLSVLGLAGLLGGLGCAGGQSGYVGTEADWSPKIAVADGDHQSAAINATYAKPLKVHLVNYDGRLMPNRVVRFWAPDTGASCTFQEQGTSVGLTSCDVMTDANSDAVTPPVIANGTVGTFTVGAGIVGVVPCSFTLTNQ